MVYPHGMGSAPVRNFEQADFPQVANEHCDQRQAAVPAQGAKRVAQVVNQDIERWHSARFAVKFLRLVPCAELDQSLAAGLFPS